MNQEIKISRSDLIAKCDQYLNGKIQEKDFEDYAWNLITEEHPDYHQIKYKQGALGDLARLYETIDWTDSLLIVSNWDEAAQIDYAKGVIKQEIADSLRVLKIEKEKQDAINKVLEDAQKSENGTGSWYFANPSLIEKGKKRFTDVWGFRILEENWRRKNKEQLTDEEFEDGTTQSSNVDNFRYGVALKRYFE